MPHLSPMKWCLMLMMFWLFLSMMSSTNWWMQMPSWPQMNSSLLSSDKKKWTW